VLQKVSSADSEVIKQISSNIEFLQRDIDELSTYICISKDIQSMFVTENHTYTNLSENDIKSQDSLKFILNAISYKTYIDGIIIYDKNGKPIYSEFTDGSSGIPTISNPSQYEIYNKMYKNNGLPIWFSINNRSDYLINNNITPKLAIGRVVKNVYNTDIMGSIFIFIDKKYIQNIYKDNIKTNKDGIFITDNNKNVVSYAGSMPSSADIKTVENLIGSKNNSTGYITYRFNGEDMLVTSSVISLTGWKLYYFTPTNTMTNQINSIKFITLLIILSCIVFSFPFMNLISSYFTKPLKTLLASMKRFEKGNFEEKVVVIANDEIGLLSEGYNKMIKNIKELIEKTYVLQLKEKEAELNALQAQINPHFLYNTLNSIFWKAQKNKQDEIAEMTMLLSKMFRLTLNKGNDWIVIEKEAELINCYLKLQKMRFNERLNYSVDISEEMLNLFIPRFIIQPFVENAVLHGIDDSSTGVNVIVIGRYVKNVLTFTIEDNGIGMNKETVDKLNSLNYQSISYKEESSGYAIRNITEKLHLIYDNNYNVIFTSELGKGTKVKITIPFTKQS
jgi:Predicted signal transduction protein with a C-terminal ATPase domain